MPIKVTVNDDRSRWTGAIFDPATPTIYIFADSYVWGVGVNDEQTFAYHLQMARPDYNVKLVAVSGYGLVHNYLRFLQIKQSIRPNDIVIIGYADYYDVRNVAAPSRLRATEAYLDSLFPDGKVPPRSERRGDWPLANARPKMQSPFSIVAQNKEMLRAKSFVDAPEGSNDRIPVRRYFCRYFRAPGSFCSPTSSTVFRSPLLGTRKH